MRRVCNFIFGGANWMTDTLEVAVAVAVAWIFNFFLENENERRPVFHAVFHLYMYIHHSRHSENGHGHTDVRPTQSSTINKFPFKFYYMFEWRHERIWNVHVVRTHQSPWTLASLTIISIYRTRWRFGSKTIFFFLSLSPAFPSVQCTYSESVWYPSENWRYITVFVDNKYDGKDDNDDDDDDGDTVACFAETNTLEIPFFFSILFPVLPAFPFCAPLLFALYPLSGSLAQRVIFSISKQ